MLQKFGEPGESRYDAPMRSRIQTLKDDPDFRSIARRWPHALQTGEGIVIPRFEELEGGGALEAIICAGAVGLRPLFEEPIAWEEARRRLLRHVEVELGVKLVATPTSTPLGAVSLEEEWGDFSVWVR